MRMKIKKTSRRTLRTAVCVLALSIFVGAGVSEASEPEICQDIDWILAAVDDASGILEEIMDLWAADADRITEALQNPALHDYFVQFPGAAEEMRAERKAVNENRRNGNRSLKELSDLATTLQQLHQENSCS